MKKIGLPGLLFFILFNFYAGSSLAQSKNNDLNNYLSKYFGNKNYEILEKKLVLNKITILIAVNFSDKKKGIIKKGIGVRVFSEKIEPYIYFENNKILDGRRKALISFPKKNYTYYGWKINYADSTKESNGGFTINPIFLSGTNLVSGDDFTIEWNPKKKMFEMLKAEEVAN